MAELPLPDRVVELLERPNPAVMVLSDASRYTQVSQPGRVVSLVGDEDLRDA